MEKEGYKTVFTAIRAGDQNSLICFNFRGARSCLKLKGFAFNLAETRAVPFG